MEYGQHKAKAAGSYQILRGQAHKLLAEVFPKKFERYRWLEMNGPNLKIHCSQMSKVELKALIDKLEKIRDEEIQRHHTARPVREMP